MNRWARCIFGAPGATGFYWTKTLRWPILKSARASVTKTVRNPHETGIVSGSPATSGVIYRLGDMVIDSRRGYIRRAGTEDLYLRHQTTQVLLYLLAHRDRVVGKEELRHAIWGDVSVTDDALVQCVVDIRRAIGDDSREQRFIKTVPRMGYRFVGPVETSEEVEHATPGRASDLMTEIPVDDTARPLLSPRVWSGRQVTVLGVVLVIVAAAAAALWSIRGTAAVDTPRVLASGTRRVVVFYFENQSGSRPYDWLRHGLADMVITALSRFDEVAVLSRQEFEVLLAREGADAERPLTLDKALALGRQNNA